MQDPESFDGLVSDALLNSLAHEGWDFAYLEDRRHTETLPWSYDDIVLGFLGGVESLLDMDTGGGEKLAALRGRATQWPSRAVAIEGYRPNIPVARRNLDPIGVEVLAYDSSEALPLPDDAFSLVVNRHGDFCATEIARILRPGGAFVTQQVGNEMCIGLNRALGAPIPTEPVWFLARAVDETQGAGLEVLEQREFKGYDLFDDIGAVVWMLTVVKWQIPDFSVERYRDRLRDLHRRLTAEGPLDARSHHFLLSARKPESKCLNG